MNIKEIIECIINHCKHFINGGSDEAVINNAKNILSLRLQRYRLNALEDYSSVKEYLTLWFANEDSEKLCCLFLDQEHRLIQCNNILFGSIHQCEGKAMKEIVRVAVISNASAIILSSDGPSIEQDDIEASSMIKLKEMQKVFSFIDVRVIDYILVCGTTTFSFKEKNMI